MLLLHLRQGLLQRRGLQGFRRGQQDRLVPVMPRRDVAVEKILLDRRQRRVAKHFALLRLHRVALLRNGGQTLHGLMLKNVLGRKANAGLPRAADHLNRDDRVAAQLEEIVVKPDPFDLEHVLPNLRQTLFQFAARRGVGLLHLRNVRLRQLFAIELAVGGQRQPVEERPTDRDHVIRQGFAQVQLDRITQRALLVRVQCLNRHDPGRQLLAAEAVHRQHHRFTHLWMLEQLRFDFAELDAETTDLHLVVDTADVLDHPVAAQAREVAGTVQTLAGLAVERVGHEAGGAHAGLIQITTGQTGASDVQLTDAALRHQVQGAVEQVPRQVDNRRANRAAVVALQIRQRQRPVGHVHGGFGDAVHVDQRRRAIAKTLEPRTQILYFQRLAAEHHVTQGIAATRLAGDLHQRLERRRCLVQHRDIFIAQQRVEILRRTADIVRHHHQFAAVQQRAENLPHGKVERVGMEQRPAVLRAKIEPVLGGAEQAHHVAVRQQRALRFAGGTGGVDDVGQIVRRGQAWRIAFDAVFRRLIQIEADQPRRNRQLPEQMALGQQQLNTAVVDHVAQAVIRVARVQRHIGAAGLQHRENGDDHVQRTLHRHADAHVRADALLDQRMRPQIGAVIELGVSQALSCEGHGHRVGMPLGLRLDGLLDALGQRLFNQRRIPLRQQLLLLACIEHWQLADTLARLGDDRLQQRGPVLRQALDGRCVEQVSGVLEHRFDAVGLFGGVEGQVELRGLALPFQRFDVQAVQARGDARTALGLVVEHHLEQRTVAEAAARFQRFDQLLEGQVLMRLRLLRRLFDLTQQFDKRQLCVDVRLEHLGVDEEADQALDFHPATVGHRHADTDVALPAVAMQQGLKRSQQQHEQGDVFLPGKGLEGIAQRRIKNQVVAGAGEALLHRARTIQRQFQHRLFAAKFCLPVGQLPLLLTGLHPLALPQGVIGVLNRQRRQTGVVTEVETGIELHQFLDHHLQRPAIGNDVVQGQHQHMLSGVDLQQRGTQQRPVLQVESLPALGLHESLDRVLRVMRQISAQVMNIEGKRSCGQDHLQGLRAVLREHRAQGFVAFDQRRNAAFQCRHIQRPLQAQGRRNVVGRAVRCPLPEEPLALLSVGQQQRLFSRALENRGNVKEVDAFLLEQNRQSLSLLSRKLSYRLD